MSSVRMCDRCKVIFSENDEGWQTFTANTQTYDDDGRQISTQIRQDACPDCALPTPNRKSSRQSETDKRIEALEQQNAKLSELTEEINKVGKAESAVT